MESTVKYRRPLSYQIGPYTVREDNGPAPRMWRVFSNSVAVFHSEHQAACFAYAQSHYTDYVTTVACPACGSPAGQKCVSRDGEVQSWPHTRRQEARNA